MKLRRLLVGLAFLAAVDAQAEECKVTISGTDTMQYQKDGKKLDEIVAPSTCKEFTIELVHSGKLPKQAMGHNWVLTLDKNMDDVVKGAMGLGPQPQGSADKGYTPSVGDFGGKVLAASNKLLGGGESDTFKVDMSKLSAKEAYSFFCSFPGHAGVMKGKFVVK